mgnify:CR=1 FL=1
MNNIKSVTITLNILSKYYKGLDKTPLFKHPETAFKGLVDKMLNITGLNNLMYSELVDIEILDCKENIHLIEDDSCVFCGVIKEETKKKGDFEWDIG